MAYKKNKKTKRHVETAIVHVKSSFNNTMVTMTTPEGDVIMRGSAGKLGYKGSRKGTPFVATKIGSTMAKDAAALFGVKNVEVNLQGPGSGRDSVVRALQGAGLNVTMLRDVTGIPFNGCRPPKKRRV
jgi:small subunit ribosomal protein S11